MDERGVILLTFFLMIVGVISYCLWAGAYSYLYGFLTGIGMFIMLAHATMKMPRYRKMSDVLEKERSRWAND